MKKFILEHRAVSLFMFLLLVLVIGGCKKYDQGYNYPAKEKKWVVSTVAGDGTADFVNGPALSARFHFPEDVIVAADGTLYVTDVLNSRIRKIAGGQVSTVAGGSGSGIVNGNGAIAQFIFPYNIALDGQGNLYTTDENDPRVRKISPATNVTTHAGTAVSGFADGNADTARFRGGNSIIADAQGNVYVADALNNRIRKISLFGKVTTIAGTGLGGFKDGDGSFAQFSNPGGITIDRQGNLYIVDRGNYRIRKITPGGVVSTVTGSGKKGDKDGAPDEVEFSEDLRDITVDGQGNLYISDWDRIRKINAQGVVATIAGSTAGFGDGDGASAKFNFPNGLGIDAQGSIYVADLNNNRIRKISFE